MYRKIESAEFFSYPNDIMWDQRNAQGVGTIRLYSAADVFHLNDTHYPKYFRYEEPWDSHCCGDWMEVSKEEYREYILKRIEEEYAEIERLKRELL